MQIKSTLIKSLIPCFLASYASQGYSKPNLDFSGFATIGLAQTITDDDKEGQFENMSNDIDFTYFNKLGLRLDADLNDKLSFTLQVVANGDNDYQPKVDWAFVDFQATNQLKLSAGKLRLPLYMYSDFKDVSYAYQWITPPYSIYGEPNFDSFDGIQVNYSMDLGGDWSSSIDVWAGHLKSDLAASGIDGESDTDFTIKELFGSSVTLDRDWLSLRAVYMQGRSTADLSALIEENTDDSLFGLVIKEAIPTSAVALKDDIIRFAGIGATLDFNQVFFNTEATYILSEPNIVVGRAISYYVMAGYRTPWDITFSFTFARDFDRPNKDSGKDFDKDLDRIVKSFAKNGRDIPIELQQLVKDQLIFNNFTTFDSSTYTLGSRWDFHPSASLKAEYIIKDAKQFRKEMSPQAIRLAVDLVF